MTDHAANGALTVRGLCVERGGQPIICDMDLDAGPGEICALMGPSGVGKSTVLRTIAALQPFSAGQIVVGGFSLVPGRLPRESQLRPLRQRVGMVFQAHALFEHLTAIENVMLAPVHALGWPRDKAHATAIELLTELGVAERAHAYPHELSGGEAQRVAIARALAPNPLLLLMDEPTAALDSARRGALGDALRTLAGTGRALLIATHDVDFARAYTDHVTVLAHGTIAESHVGRGAPEGRRDAAPTGST